ncbi:MAG: pantetheine-phosphate adenylyltransferase [Verrucomicrobia bacterium]|nr:pantetheine-phosphate adenylyltransferase [Verrucomicrobiota bacterium]
MPKIVVYPGSFDPPTNGHLDVLRRAAKLAGTLYVAVATNTSKKPLFSVEERVDLLRKTTADVPNVKVVSFDGLLVDYAQRVGAAAIIRGLRALSDFEYEFQMALTNRRLNKEVETLFLMPSEEYSYLSSHMIKEIGRLGGDLSPFVPPEVAELMKQRQADEGRGSQDIP